MAMAANIIEEYGKTAASVEKCFEEEVWDEVLPELVATAYAGSAAKSRELYRMIAGEDVIGQRPIRKRYRVVFNPQSEVIRLEAEQSQAKVVDARTEREFRAYADKWLKETAPLSDPVQIFMHPSHLKIIGMGEKIVPFVLKEVERQSGHWFVALEAISPVNPVQPEDEISFQRTADAWIRWGKAEGLIG